MCVHHVHMHCTWIQLQKQHKKRKAPIDVRFSALHLIHDPQEFAEKLFQRLERATEKFDIKLMMMALIAQLIGVHKVMNCTYMYLYIYLFADIHVHCTWVFSTLVCIFM